MQHKDLMDAFYGFQPIIIMDLLTSVLGALYSPFTTLQEQHDERRLRLQISNKVPARDFRMASKPQAFSGAQDFSWPET